MASFFVLTEAPIALTFAKLLAAWVFGMLLGLERERVGRAAGVRTLGLVSAGSALFSVLSLAMAGEQADPGRIAAGIVTGIGFLGAGTIMRSGLTVHGLTTAASIWTAAAIGMACGFGWIGTAAVATALVFLTLAVLRPLAHALRPHTGQAVLSLTAHVSPQLLHDIAHVLHSKGCTLRGLDLSPDQEGHSSLTLQISLPQEVPLSEVIAALSVVEGVVAVEAL